ncbi:imidazole glycerol phosphate synthase cyclase subunit, partial [bacterium]|nr:imidazole glycerol phosphate synthase cyclase subunit [bacterium]
MKKVRVIVRLDVKGPNVIKGVHLECLRIVGKPGELAERYYLQGADELTYMDIVASLYGRQNLLNIVHQASDKIFIPFTVGGGVRTIDDIKEFLKAGADKVAMNTAATKNPELIR